MRRGIPSRPSMCIGRNVRLKPMNMSQKLPLPEALVEHPPEHLRPPVVEPGEEREDDPAEQRRSGSARRRSTCRCTCQSTGNAARKIPVRPPNVKSARKPSAKSIGVSKLRLPRQVVASQLKILIPVGTAMTIDEIMKKLSSPIAEPGREHVVRPDEHREERDRERRERDAPCSRRSACGRRPAGSPRSSRRRAGP